MLKIIRTLSLVALATALLLPTQALADTLNLSLADPIQTTQPGSTLSFIATVSAPNTNAADVSLDSDPNGADYPLTLDDSGFVAFPLSLSPGDSFTGELFTITIPNYAADGLYQGFFEIMDDTTGVSATVNFQVNAVPEPASILLLLAGLGLLVLTRRKQLREKNRSTGSTIGYF